MSQGDTLPRKDYLRQQKEGHGRRLVGVFPAHYPREILWAHNALPVEIWDPPLEPARAHRHLQAYICSVVKLGLELVLKGTQPRMDAFLFPHTCDSLQNLASVVNDVLGVDTPCLFFYHPKAPYTEAAGAYYRARLEALAGELEALWGPAAPEGLVQAVEWGKEVTGLIGRMYTLRAAGRLKASNARFYQVLRQGEYLHPEDFIPLLKRFLGAAQGRGPDGPGVVLSGVLPNPPEILAHLDRLGVRVVGDDLLSCSRRWLQGPSLAQDPWEALVEGYLAMPPCSSKAFPLSNRLEFLLKTVRNGKACGVLFAAVKFCEPELFDIPPLVEGLKARDIPSLVLEVDLNQGLTGQLATRIEAFAEMIGTS